MSDSDSVDTDVEETVCERLENGDGKAPDDIEFDDVVVDISLHPSKDVIAAGTMDGDIFVYSYSEEGPNHELITLNHHKKCCRALSFSHDGNLLFSTSRDKSIKIVDMNAGSLSHKIIKAHESPIYCLLPIDDYLLATGDDNGNFKVWDFRRKTAIMENKQCEEYISDMVIDEQRRIIAATSGEGTLTAFNIRARRMELQSELFDSEFLSAAVVKNGRKVLVGTGEGAINIFNWGEWGNISDRFPGHPESVDRIIAINNNIVCTGSSDGKIRAVHMFPHRFLGIVGDHEDFPIESLSVSNNRKYLASCSHDQTVKFWNISSLENVLEHPNEKGKRRKTDYLSSSKRTDFFADLVE
ncbi:WD repeat-containing protein 55 [Centruroides vittatus]|uniref:WD repeat-containing protein 55 n=1 Tax=Centruroides vittatus TaxID=120091 RepID=UPI0035102008